MSYSGRADHGRLEIEQAGQLPTVVPGRDKQVFAHQFRVQQDARPFRGRHPRIQKFGYLLQPVHREASRALAIGRRFALTLQEPGPVDCQPIERRRIDAVQRGEGLAEFAG